MTWLLSIICKIVAVLMLLGLIVLICQFFWIFLFNGGRKWYYYNPAKPWKGGYWEPLLPSEPPYNEYRWNPKTSRFENRKTGQPLHSWQKAYNPETQTYEDQTQWDWNVKGVPEDRPKKRKRPEWVRFLFEENLGTIMERRRKRKSS